LGFVVKNREKLGSICKLKLSCCSEQVFGIEFSEPRGKKSGSLVFRQCETRPEMSRGSGFVQFLSILSLTRGEAYTIAGVAGALFLPQHTEATPALFVN